MSCERESYGEIGREKRETGSVGEWKRESKREREGNLKTQTSQGY